MHTSFGADSSPNKLAYHECSCATKLVNSVTTTVCCLTKNWGNGLFKRNEIVGRMYARRKKNSTQSEGNSIFWNLITYLCAGAETNCSKEMRGKGKGRLLAWTTCPARRIIWPNNGLFLLNDESLHELARAMLDRQTVGEGKSRFVLFASPSPLQKNLGEKPDRTFSNFRAWKSDG